MDPNISSYDYNSMVVNFSSPNLDSSTTQTNSNLSEIAKISKLVKSKVVMLDPINDEAFLWFLNYEKALISINKIEFAKEILLDYLDAKYSLPFYYKAKR